jgi:pyrroloquinoline-quinone synthase
MSCAPRISAIAEAILQRVGILKNPYFAALTDGSMSLPQFRATQEQFYFAVKYFPRPMAALASRIPDPAERLDLLRNIVEEHGDFQPEQFHLSTFRAFLASIGARIPDRDGISISPAVHAFNNVLMASCLCDEVETAVCCLGIVEQAFAEISALIGQTVVRREWVKSTELVHYALHTEIDVRHAEELFAAAEPRLDCARGKHAIQQGLELGAFAFDQLYRNLPLIAREE